MHVLRKQVVNSKYQFPSPVVIMEYFSLSVTLFENNCVSLSLA